MKTKDLTDLGIADDVAEKILILHGKDIESHKGKLTAAESERDNFKTQLEKASEQIKAFEGLDIDGVKKAAADWEAKATQAQTEAAAALLKVKQDHALERELKETFKVKDLVAVRAHLKVENLKYNEKEDTFLGLKEQVEPLKGSFGSYFSDYVEPPRIVTGGNNQTIHGDSVLDAMRKGAGLTAPTK